MPKKLQTSHNATFWTAPSDSTDHAANAGHYELTVRHRVTTTLREGGMADRAAVVVGARSLRGRTFAA
jgi:hypothetical protein